MEQLTQHQFKLLKRLANSPVKTYCSPAGIRSDRKCDEITRDFNEVLRLVEIGLVTDASDWEKYIPIVQKYAEEGGREVTVVVLNLIGDRMFKRTGHDKWVN